MLRLASDPDSTYVPYAKTNKQITEVIPSNASASNKLVTESDVDYFYQASDVEGEYDANDFAVVGKITRYCVKSPVHGYQVNGTAWWGFYETVCFRGGGYGYQTFRTMLGTSVMAIRQLYNGSWGSWQKLVTESNLNPVAITTPTPVSGVTGGDNLIYGFKSGKMVTIVLNGIIMANDIAQNRPIFTNVPTAVGNKNIYFTVLDYENGKSAVMSIIGNSLDSAFQSDDKNKVHAGRYWGTVAYMTSD
jgi:hypothetical protein